MSAEEHIHYVPEPAAVELRVVVWAAIASLLLLGGSIGGFYQLYRREVAVKNVSAPQDYPQPRVTTHAKEVEQLRRLAAEQSQRLKTWRWANDQHTQIQIPIDRAMQLLVQKGAGAWAPLLPPQPALATPTAGAENAITPTPPPPEKEP
ncbi:MAG TPA: hypothetical protein VGH13_00385 [Xanthobacteraceae bacterium]|jgi:hypothetical protein